MAKLLSESYYQEGILAGNRVVLSKAITLVESTKTEHKNLAYSLLDNLLKHTGKSLRVGITGVPGAGKSSFIETLGLSLAESGRKVAVLAIDPTSSQTKGSILGDKTRMEKLAVHPNAFIRPSAAGFSLGGVAQKTREAMLLCEAAGFDTILIETVGVGQSETAVSSMVDFFMLVALTGGGDELQGMKRGIMEMADLIVVNKADGDNLRKAKQTAVEYNRALSLFPKRTNGWKPKSIPVSAYTSLGIEKAWNAVEEFASKDEKLFQNNRKEQQVQWMHETLKETLLQKLYGTRYQLEKLAQFEGQIRTGEISPYGAAKEALQLLMP